MSEHEDELSAREGFLKRASTAGGPSESLGRYAAAASHVTRHACISRRSCRVASLLQRLDSLLLSLGHRAVWSLCPAQCASENPMAEHPLINAMATPDHKRRRAEGETFSNVKMERSKGTITDKAKANYVRLQILSNCKSHNVTHS